MDYFDQPILPDPVIDAYKPGVDTTLFIENLKLTHEERLTKLMQMQQFVEEMQRAGRSARGEDASSSLRILQVVHPCGLGEL